MRQVVFQIWMFLMAWSSQGQNTPYVTVSRTMDLMGSSCEISVVAVDEEIGYINIEEAVAEIQRIEKMISTTDKSSETYLINENAGIGPVKVGADLFKLIERSIQISEITEGAFDITYAVLDNIWRFDGSMKYPPTEREIKGALEKVGYKKIILDPTESTVFLKEKGMKISFVGIGKGYAADMAKEFLVSKEVRAGMINAGGDLTTWGTRASGEKWLLGVDDPEDPEKILSWLPIVESSAATSLHDEKFLNFGGIQYTDVMDPRTGYPSTGIRSVSIFSKTAELSDALSTAVFVLGAVEGLALIAQLRDTQALIVDTNNQLHKSSGLILETSK
ncbi:MAG: FAD:protein FMN transferase [Sediminicola sp.]